MKEYKEQDVYAAIKSGFADLKVLARVDLKKRWKSMDGKQRFAAGRALVYMDGVIKNPAKYFSRASTQSDWVWRAETYANEKNLDDVADAYYIVQNPQSIVLNAAHGALSGGIYAEFYRFCNSVQQWEYDRTSNKVQFSAQAYKFAEDIIKRAERYKAMVAISRANPLIRPVKQFVYQIQH